MNTEGMNTEKLMAEIYSELSHCGGITDKINELLKEVKDRLERLDSMLDNRDYE
jgi:heterodisulfide reductase subunit B